MKLTHQVIQFVWLPTIAVASKAFVPQTEEGIYRYHPDTGKHVRIGPIQQNTGKVKVPVPPSAKSKPNPRKVPRSLERLLEDSDSVDYDLLARELFNDEDDEDEDEFQEFQFRDADPLAILWGEGLGLHGMGPPVHTHKPTSTPAPSTTKPAPPSSVATQPTPTVSSLGGPGQGFVADSSGCKNEIVSPQDFASAYESLAIACGTGYNIARNSHMYAVSGSAMVYTCSTATNWDNNPCQATEMWTAFTTIQNKCPNYRVGWAHDNKSYKSYGLELVGVSICGQTL